MVIRMVSMMMAAMILCGCEKDGISPSVSVAVPTIHTWTPYAGFWSGSGRIMGVSHVASIYIDPEVGNVSIQGTGFDGTMQPWNDRMEWQFDDYKRIRIFPEGTCWYYYGTASFEVFRDSVMLGMGRKGTADESDNWYGRIE